MRKTFMLPVDEGIRKILNETYEIIPAAARHRNPLIDRLMDLAGSERPDDS